MQRNKSSQHAVRGGNWSFLRLFCQLIPDKRQGNQHSEDAPLLNTNPQDTNETKSNDQFTLRDISHSTVISIVLNQPSPSLKEYQLAASILLVPDAVLETILLKMLAPQDLGRLIVISKQFHAHTLFKTHVSLKKLLLLVARYEPMALS